MLNGTCTPQRCMEEASEQLSLPSTEGGPDPLPATSRLSAERHSMPPHIAERHSGPAMYQETTPLHRHLFPTKLACEPFRALCSSRVAISVPSLAASLRHRGDACQHGPRSQEMPVSAACARSPSLSLRALQSPHAATFRDVQHHPPPQAAPRPDRTCLFCCIVPRLGPLPTGTASGVPMPSACRHEDELASRQVCIPRAGERNSPSLV